MIDMAAVVQIHEMSAETLTLAYDEACSEGPEPEPHCKDQTLNARFKLAS